MGDFKKLIESYKISKELKDTDKCIKNTMKNFQMGSKMYKEILNVLGTKYDKDLSTMFMHMSKVDGLFSSILEDIEIETTKR